MNEQTSKTRLLKQKQLYFKMGFILLLIMLLLIPNAFIKDIIHERSSLLYQAKNDISSTWGGAQKIGGPILSIPYTTIYKDKEGDSQIFTHKLYITPENVDIQSNVTTQERKKGIYSTTLYTATNELKSKFLIPPIETFGKNLNEVQWSETEVILPLSEPESITSTVHIFNGKSKVKMRSFSSTALHRGLKATIDIDGKSIVDISTTFESRGSQNISFIPTGANTKIKMICDWPSPGFEGKMLPVTREITDSGFTAEWSANEYNRPMPEFWNDNEYQLKMYDIGFGVKLVQTVDHYQKNLRSIKYSLLIISLSFMIFFFFEILKNQKIHPLQYILIGMALTLFYLLLLSFSEHVGFNLAYGIASISTIGLVSWYSKTMLKAGNSVFSLAGILSGLYIYIFVLLQMEDYALLAGSIGLFVILAAVMTISKKMDWYQY